MVDDLHEKNALVVREKPLMISVIDPVIYLDSDFKMRRLAEYQEAVC
jgi:hypothetical protein